MYKIRVSSREFTLPTPEYPLGIYDTATVYPEITQGKLGVL
jgi:hypothetical protein